MPDIRRFRAALLDLDGVITRTADQHFAAWKQTFDELSARFPSTDPRFPFDRTEYNRLVDGRPRFDGVRAFLADRGIELPEGPDNDEPSLSTVHGVGAYKNALVNEIIRDSGVEVFPDAVTFVTEVRARGLATAVVSASQNCALVLEAAGMTALFDTRIDGTVAIAEGLPGKPAPDTFLAAARRLAVEPSSCIVVEDAIAGVEAGRAGGFGLVVGVDRVGHAAALKEHGADIVVERLTDLL